MLVCVFDNPIKMRREAYQNGKVVAHISAELMFTKGFNGHERMFFGLNVGRDFIPCKVYGDNLAMKGE